MGVFRMHGNGTGPAVFVPCRIAHKCIGIGVDMKPGAQHEGIFFNRLQGLLFGFGVVAFLWPLMDKEFSPKQGNHPTTP